MSAKTILLTGGNRGLGRATTELLLRRGHRVIMTSRDLSSGEESARELRALIPGAQLECRALDVSSLSSIRSLARAWSEEGRPVDVLFHNAGVMQQSPTRRETVDGFEETFATNVLGPFLLTRLLLPWLERSPKARVVCVTSRLHLPDSRGVPVDFRFEDPQLTSNYHPERAYKNSKLALLWFTFSLAKKLPGHIKANAICPGFVPTTAAASVTGFQHLLLKWILPLMPFATKLPVAAAHLADMATDPRFEQINGTFWADGQEATASEEARDAEKAERFWRLAASLVGVEP